MSEIRERLQAARLHVVCDGQDLAAVDAALRGGAQIVQLRVKGDDPGAAILAAAPALRRMCADHSALFIINDRPELVGAARADGVHLGQDDMPIAQARQLLGPDRLIGLSTHTPAQIDAAGEQDIDYIGVGPVYATPTKPGRPAVGLELVRHAAEHAAVPFFAIGGINPANVDAVRAAGASGVAVVRAITEAEDPFTAARKLAAGDRVGTT